MSPTGPLFLHPEVLRRGEVMGSQLRFDPSFFGLALRASAEADALLFSAHEGLSGITRPTRAGLRLTSPVKASGGRSSIHKERIPLHKESGFLCRKRRARGKRAAEAGARRKHVGIRTRRARGKHSPAYHSMSRGGCQGEYTPGGIWVRERIRWGNERK